MSLFILNNDVTLIVLSYLSLHDILSIHNYLPKTFVFNNEAMCINMTGQSPTILSSYLLRQHKINYNSDSGCYLCMSGKSYNYKNLQRITLCSLNNVNIYKHLTSLNEVFVCFCDIECFNCNEFKDFKTRIKTLSFYEGSVPDKTCTEISKNFTNVNICVYNVIPSIFKLLKFMNVNELSISIQIFIYINDVYSGEDFFPCKTLKISDKSFHQSIVNKSEKHFISRKDYFKQTNVIFSNGVFTCFPWPVIFESFLTIKLKILSTLDFCIWAKDNIPKNNYTLEKISYTVNQLIYFNT